MDEIGLSGLGTIAAARVTADAAPPFIVVSMAASWIRPHPSVETTWMGYQDGGAQRIISDLSAFIGSTDPATHGILAAGDLNMIYGATDDNRLALPAGDRTVTDRMEALGLEFMGPQNPAGRQADPLPAGLPSDTLNVPTIHAPTQSPATAAIRLDYAFGSPAARPNAITASASIFAGTVWVTTIGGVLSFGEDLSVSALVVEPIDVVSAVAQQENLFTRHGQSPQAASRTMLRARVPCPGRCRGMRRCG